MVRIVKLRARNFKAFGPDNELAFEFQKTEGTSAGTMDLLGGPNGYGKTTIFDVIEICITGSLDRLPNGVQNNNTNSRKMPFVHKKGVDVDFVILLEEQTTTGAVVQHIIARKYAGTSTGIPRGGGRANKPEEFFTLLDGYYSTDPSSYDGEIFNPRYSKDPNEILKTITHLLFGGKTIDISKFLLLNYCQQGRNLRFLESGERSKRNDISFLFGTQDLESKLAKLNNQLASISTITSALTGAIELIREANQANSVGEIVPYAPLFLEKGIQWDAEHPFLNMTSEVANQNHRIWVDLVENLSAWHDAFDPIELSKKEKRTRNRALATNAELLYAFLIRDLLSGEQFESISNISENVVKFQRLQSELGNRRREGQNNYSSFLIDLAFTSEEIAAFEVMKTEWIGLRGNLSDLNRLRAEMIRKRLELLESFERLNSHNHLIDNSICPLCGHDWITINAWLKAIKEQEEKLASFSSLQENRVVEIQKVIDNQYVSKIEAILVKFLNDPENNRKRDLYALVADANSNRRNEHLDRAFQILKELEIDPEVFRISASSSKTDVDSMVPILRQTIEEANSKILVDEEKTKDEKSFYKEYFNSNESAFEALTLVDFEGKISYLNQEFRTSNVQLLKVLEDRLAKVGAIEGRIRDARNGLDNHITFYKSETVKNIQIPTFVYSAKILQNCPQGDGIYLQNNDTNNAIRILMDNYSSEDNRSEHDIMFHLSSGQLAVAAIAVLFALNKLSDIPFKFIAIDDPLQTLDDLNIHSLVEVLRHDFRDYQFLFSTHEDDAARFLFYRFRKAGKAVKYVDMKREYLGVVMG